MPPALKMVGGLFKAAKKIKRSVVLNQAKFTAPALRKRALKRAEQLLTYAHSREVYKSMRGKMSMKEIEALVRRHPDFEAQTKNLADYWMANGTVPTYHGVRNMARKRRVVKSVQRRAEKWAATTEAAKIESDKRAVTEVDAMSADYAEAQDALKSRTELEEESRHTIWNTRQMPEGGRLDTTEGPMNIGGGFVPMTGGMPGRDTITPRPEFLARKAEILEKKALVDKYRRAREVQSALDHSLAEAGQQQTPLLENFLEETGGETPGDIAGLMIPAPKPVLDTLGQHLPSRPGGPLPGSSLKNKTPPSYLRKFGPQAAMLAAIFGLDPLMRRVGEAQAAPGRVRQQGQNALSTLGSGLPSEEELIGLMSQNRARMAAMDPQVVSQLMGNRASTSGEFVVGSPQGPDILNQVIMRSMLNGSAAGGEGLSQLDPQVLKMLMQGSR